MTDELTHVLYVETAKRTTRPRDENDAVMGRYGSLGYKIAVAAFRTACPQAGWTWLKEAEVPFQATVAILSTGDERGTEQAWRRLREELSFDGPIFLTWKHDAEDRTLPEALQADEQLFVLTERRADKALAEIRTTLGN